nr:Down syndrome cell adhesion molecule-like protein Dscam2 [Penaeus vannamei]
MSGWSPGCQTTAISTCDKYGALTAGTWSSLPANSSSSPSPLKTAAGVFRCRTHHDFNRESTLSTTGRLVVSEPVGPISPPDPDPDHRPYVSRFSNTYTLYCQVQAYPVPTYRWFKVSEDENQTAVELGRYVRQVGGTLVIINAKVEHSGKYLCAVENAVGIRGIDIELTVTAPLKAQVEPKVQTVEFGQPATFTCSYQGNPVKSLTWLKDGIPLDHKEAVLRIGTVGHADKGMYQCFVRNDQESAQGTAELRLEEESKPPQLIDTFQTITLQPGPAVSLRCAAAGRPAPEITWEIDGARLAHSERMQIGEVNGEVVSYLNISAVDTIDGGLYACIASSTVGSVRHAARLNVYGLPYIRPMAKSAVVAGENLVVHCPVTGYPIDSIDWEKNGRMLPINHRQKTFPNGTLIVEAVQGSTDQGKYTCVARNREGYIARGDLDVQVIGHTPGDYHDLDVNNPNIKVIDDGPLHISSIQKSHEGYYLCEASNGVGAGLSTVIYIRVQAPSQFKIQYRNQTALRGKDAVLECEAGGETPISIRWRKDKHSVDDAAKPRYTIREEMHGGSVHSSLSIKSADRTDSAVYTCVATNAFGSADTSINLSIQECPEQPSNLTVLDVGSRSVELSWPSPYNGNSPITRYFVEYKLRQHDWENYGERMMVPGNQTQAAVLDLRPATTYHLRIVARNEIGDSDPSDIVTFTTDEEAPPHPPEIQLQSSTTNSIEVKLTPSMIDDTTPIHGYTIYYKPEFSTLETVQVPASTRSYLLEGLWCGSRYQIYASAYNKKGTSESSEILNTRTKGKKPEIPEVHRVVEVFPMAIELHLEAWGDGGCPMNYFALEYKPRHQTEWITASNQVRPIGNYIIMELTPATWYNLRISAHNNAGSSVAEYEVATLTRTGSSLT